MNFGMTTYSNKRAPTPPPKIMPYRPPTPTRERLFCNTPVKTVADIAVVTGLGVRLIWM